MDVKFRVSVLPILLEPVFQFLTENHSLLARLRVRDGSDGETQFLETNCDRLRYAVSSVWTVDLNARVVEWLETVGEVNSDYPYETWVVRSLWFLMNPSVEVADRTCFSSDEFVLPHHLQYFEKEARDAKLGTEQEAVAYAAEATQEQRSRMFEVAKTMHSNGHAKEVFAFLNENSIVTFESSRPIYWYLGAMDFAGAKFD